MTGVPRLKIETTGSPPVSRIIRPTDSPPYFWERLRSEFTAALENGRSQIRIRADRLLLDRHILRAVLEQYRVGLDIDTKTREMLQAAEAERTLLTAILDDPPSLSIGQVEEALSGTRFMRTLAQFQLRDLSVLLALPHGANFSVPGAGKTTSTCATYEVERARGNVEQLLVVGPLSSFEAWEGEAVECFDPVPKIHRYVTPGGVPPSAEVVLVGYQRLVFHFDRLARWVDGRKTHVVLDEAHRMKRGRDGAWGTACLDLAYGASRRDILSGTPAPQSPADLGVLMSFLWPTQGRRLVPTEAHVVNPPPEVATGIARRIGPLFVRTSKRELNLPPVNLKPVSITLSGLHREIYDSLRSRFAASARLGRRDRATLSALGRIVMYMLEAATNPALLVAGASPHDAIDFRHPPLDIPDGSPLMELLQDYPSYETPAKFKVLAGIVRDNATQGRKTLVWTNFVRNLTTLKRELAGLNPAMIHGGIPILASGDGVSRESELDRFRHDPTCHVLLANPASIGEGVSLHQVCNDAVYVDRTFNAGQYLQSVDRIHRLGLAEDTVTTVTFLLTEDTIDEVVDTRVRVKAETLGRLLDDPDISTMSLPDEDEYGLAIDPGEDLDALLAHLQAGTG